MEKDTTYLTQEKLAEYLSSFCDIETEVKVEGTRFKSDIQFENNGTKFAVEFDGDAHFTDLKVIERDIRKNKVLTEQGFSVVRIPYFIQLTRQTFVLFFGFDYPRRGKKFEKYPHGFIDKNAKTPAHFSSQGMDKFISIMMHLAEKWSPVYFDIMDSMVNHEAKDNFSNIIPENLGYPKLKDLAEHLVNHRNLYRYTHAQRKTLDLFLDAKFVKNGENYWSWT